MRRISMIAAMSIAVLFSTAYSSQQKPANLSGADISLPSVDRVLEKYIEALGGKAALQKISSRVSIGKFILNGSPMAGHVEIYAKAPNKHLVVMVLPNSAVLRQGYDGKIAWQQMPQSPEPEELSGAELTAARHEAEFYQSLKLRELYPELTVKGKEKVKDRDTFVLEAPRNGNPKRWYFDAETGLLLRAVDTQGGDTSEEFYEDYRTVDGVKVAFTILQKGEDEVQIILTEVKHNVEIADAMFDKPTAKRDKASDF